MTTHFLHTAQRSRPLAGSAALVLALALLGGCASGLLPKPAAQPTLLRLEDGPASAMPAAPASARPGDGAATLIVDMPRAAAGLDTRNIAYLRRPLEIEYYAVHQWVETPAHMLAPLLVRALQRSGAFRAVVAAPTVVVAGLRLETDLLRLQQDFTQTPSRVQLTLRALLIDTATRRVLAWREFDTSVAATSEDAYGGAAAANQAVQQLLAELAVFCAAAVPP